MLLFLSTTTNKVDKKGRVSVPAAFRAQLPADGYQGIVVYESLKYNCIEGADLGFMERITDSINGDFGLYSDAHEALANSILGGAHQLSFDPEGRILLPKDLLTYAGIDNEATYVGLGKSFQIWKPSAYLEHKAQFKQRALEEIPNLRPIGSGRNGGGERP
ncbi:MAG: hypothetical protein KAI28_08910 [Sphingomonadales bacterium]|nr:hypothetical protein [Sphingomonadales bacterium]